MSFFCSLLRYHTPYIIRTSSHDNPPINSKFTILYFLFVYPKKVIMSIDNYLPMQNWNRRKANVRITTKSWELTEVQVKKKSKRATENRPFFTIQVSFFIFFHIVSKYFILLVRRLPSCEYSLVY